MPPLAASSSCARAPVGRRERGARRRRSHAPSSLALAHLASRLGRSYPSAQARRLAQERLSSCLCVFWLWGGGRGKAQQSEFLGRSFGRAGGGGAASSAASFRHLLPPSRSVSSPVGPGGPVFPALICVEMRRGADGGADLLVSLWATAARQQRGNTRNGGPSVRVRRRRRVKRHGHSQQATLAWRAKGPRGADRSRGAAAAAAAAAASLVVLAAARERRRHRRRRRARRREAAAGRTGARPGGRRRRRRDRQRAQHHDEARLCHGRCRACARPVGFAEACGEGGALGPEGLFAFGSSGLNLERGVELSTRKREERGPGGVGSRSKERAKYE